MSIYRSYINLLYSLVVAATSVVGLIPTTRGVFAMTQNVSSSSLTNHNASQRTEHLPSERRRSVSTDKALIKRKHSQIRGTKSFPAHLDHYSIKPSVITNALARARIYEAEIARAADRYGIDPRLLWCIAFNETRFLSHDGFGRVRISPKGARGLMQFTQATALRFHIDPNDDRQSIYGAAAYLRTLLDRYHGDAAAALAAYNAGEGAVDAFRYGMTIRGRGKKPINPNRVRTDDGLPPFAETRNYVRQAQALWQSVNWVERFRANQLKTTVAESMIGTTTPSRFSNNIARSPGDEGAGEISSHSLVKAFGTQINHRGTVERTFINSIVFMKPPVAQPHSLYINRTTAEKHMIPTDDGSRDQPFNLRLRPRQANVEAINLPPTPRSSFSNYRRAVSQN